MTTSPVFKTFGGMCLTLLAILTYGCASNPKLSPQAAKVRSVTADQAMLLENQCRFIGNVHGNASSLFFDRAAHTVSFAEVLENAGGVGATHVFINDGDSYTLRGIAYFCAHCQQAGGPPLESFCEDADGNPLPKIVLKRTCVSNGHKWREAPQDIDACDRSGGEWVENPAVLRKKSRN